MLKLISFLGRVLCHFKSRQSSFTSWLQMSIYQYIYIAPLHHIRSILQYSLLQGLSVFHSFMTRSHLLPDQLPGEHSSDLATFLLQCDNLGQCKYFCIRLVIPPTIQHVPMFHTFFYVHQSHRRDSTHPDRFTGWGTLSHLKNGASRAPILF